MLISFGSVAKPYQSEEKRGRVGLFECECGCGQTFFSAVKTKHPKYANKTHRTRAYRARAWARVVASGYPDNYQLVYENCLNDELSRNRGKL